MEKTGESYTTARVRILAGPAGKDSGSVAAPVMPVAESKLRDQTGRGWEEWFELLDDLNGGSQSHTETARFLRENCAVEDWWSQAITVGYERARGLRAVGQRSDGFVVTAQRTIAVGADRLFDVFVNETSRSRWLQEDKLHVRTATKARSARFDWGDGTTRVNVDFEDKGEAKSTVAVAHERLPNAGEAERLKTMWRSSLTKLKEHLEGG